jgi:hypothetical protein
MQNYTLEKERYFRIKCNKVIVIDKYKRITLSSNIIPMIFILFILSSKGDVLLKL